MIRCIIIEDQPPAQRILQKYIIDIGTLELCGSFSDAIQGLEFLKTQSVDLIFLDIHLPKISGIDFLKTIKSPPAVILTTAFSEYAIESYEFDVVDYLLKPFSFQRFVKAITKIKPTTLSEQKEASQSNNVVDEIFVKSGYEHVKIRISDIQYIRSDTDYTELITVEKKYLSNEPLKHWLRSIDQFVQVHKSFIINPSYIQKVSGNQIHLKNETIVPIGRAYKEAFVNQFLS